LLIYWSTFASAKWVRLVVFEFRVVCLCEMGSFGRFLVFARTSGVGPLWFRQSPHAHTQRPPFIDGAGEDFNAKLVVKLLETRWIYLS